MYIPAHFLPSDREDVIRFMQRYSFATLVTIRDGKSEANHLPFTIHSDGDSIRLRAHMSKANKQWHHLQTGSALVIFNEPHAYVSPRHYDKVENVPTWNYMAVHAYGPATLLEPGEATREAVEQMIDQYEPEYADQWKNLSEEYRQKMLKGIVAFEMTVTELQAKNKLSQNRTETEQKRVVNALMDSHDSVQQAIGAAMRENLLKKLS
jgi:transcriptional regulator